MQSGNSIVARAAETDAPTVTFADRAQDGTIPAESALQFYAEFADPNKNVYSWNRSLPNSHDAFIGGTLGLYFGFASELAGIRARNPNLNFDVAPFPTTRAVSTTAVQGPATFGEMYALGIPKATKNPDGALAVAELLSGSTGGKALVAQLGVAPARRDLISVSPQDAVGSTLYATALAAGAWLDPSPAKSDAVFQTMVESVTTGRAQVSEAINTAQRSFAALVSSR